MRKEFNLHYIGKFEEAAFRLPAGYENYSQGYSRVALIDHTAGSVHMGLGICQLEQGGTLAPHIQAYEESFFILEGLVLGSIDGRAYQLGPGDYGIILPGMPHTWRTFGEQPVRWLKMLVDRTLGAQHLTLFMVEFQPGGEGVVHDHPFEESYFILSGEADVLLDGNPGHVKAGDCVWTGVGSTHGFFNRGT